LLVLRLLCEKALDVGIKVGLLDVKTITTVRIS
jgi:hypothetical protein